MEQRTSLVRGQLENVSFDLEWPDFPCEPERLRRRFPWAGHCDARRGLSRRPQMPHQSLMAWLLREAADVTRCLSSFPGLPVMEALVCVPFVPGDLPEGAETRQENLAAWRR